ncbi:hypothetical protein [Capnocytophaga gingivalis]|jgi:hypothetical protein|uniref:hypothetical protein n=1 Tax=Capnocytophaga gingivalis TaxID=1017 RepID=UPI0028D5F25C|nr:hypothetical protein [Capnocytophaga gingivalis]
METLEKNKENSEGSLELSNELKRLQRNSNRLKIFKEMSVLGIGSGVKSVKNILFFTIVNLIFFLVGVYLLFSHTFTYKKLFFLLLMIGIGVLFVLIAIRKVFDLLKMEYASYLFNQFQPQIHKVFEGVFQKAENTTEKIVSKGQLQDTFRRFLPKIPKAFQKPLLFVLSFTPMVGFVADIVATPTLTSPQRQSDVLYEKVQHYMQESVEDERRGYWVLWVLLINALLQGFLLYMLL